MGTDLESSQRASGMTLFILRNCFLVKVAAVFGENGGVCYNNDTVKERSNKKEVLGYSFEV